MRKILIGMTLCILGLDTVSGMSGRVETCKGREVARLCQVSFEGLLSRDTVQSLISQRKDSASCCVAIGDYQLSLEVVCVQINSQNTELLRRALESKMESFEQTISEKDRIIEELKSQIVALSHTSAELRQTLAASEIELQKREEEITQALETIRGTFEEREPLVTQKQFERTMQRIESIIERQSNASSERSLITQDTLTRAQDNLRVLFESTLDSLQDRHEEQLDCMTRLFEERCSHLTEAYERQIDMLRDVVTTLTMQNERMQKEAELKSIVGRILMAHPSSQLIITERAQDIGSISDLFQRRDRVQGLYGHFQLFRELYGREDLEVEVTSTHLQTIKDWLDTVSINRYGVFTLPNPCPGYHNEEGRDCPEYRKHAFSGKDMGGNILHQERERIESLLLHFENHSLVEEARARLNSIFQNTSAADTSVFLQWSHSWFWGHRTNILSYTENGKEKGYFFHEYGGGFWKELRGFAGSFSGKFWVPWESGDARDLWNSQFVSRYNEALNITFQAIQERARLLVDFETSSESPLNQLYIQAGETSPSIVYFPTTELEVLIKQYNNFIKMSF